jgi:hypothetical protein
VDGRGDAGGGGEVSGVGGTYTAGPDDGVGGADAGDANEVGSSGVEAGGGGAAGGAVAGDATDARGASDGDTGEGVTKAGVAAGAGAEGRGVLTVRGKPGPGPLGEALSGGVAPTTQPVWGSGIDFSPIGGGLPASRDCG